MFTVASLVGRCKTSWSRLLPSIVTGNTRFASVCVEPTAIHEAPILENECVLATPCELCEMLVEESVIVVPRHVDITPITGVPSEHVVTRIARIYQVPKNTMQSGISKVNDWEIDFDNRQRWSHPLMGWTSTGDPLSRMKVSFSSPEEAVDFCKKNGWRWFLEEPQKQKVFGPKSYSANFSWNRRTRVSTK